MVEFYQAYATFEDLIQLTEELFAAIARRYRGGLQLPYNGDHLSILTRPWQRLTIREAVHGSWRRRGKRRGELGRPESLRQAKAV